MDYHLPNVDNCGHLANYHLPHFVHVGIERPLSSRNPQNSKIMLFLIQQAILRGEHQSPKGTAAHPRISKKFEARLNIFFSITKFDANFR